MKFWYMFVVVLGEVGCGWSSGDVMVGFIIGEYVGIDFEGIVRDGIIWLMGIRGVVVVGRIDFVKIKYVLIFIFIDFLFNKFYCIIF